MGFGESASQSDRIDAAAARLSKMSIGRSSKHDDLGSWVKKIIKDVHGDEVDAESKMTEITPELKERVGSLLSHTHKPLATAFTTLSLTQLKRWLRGHVSARDLGSEGKAELNEKLNKLTSSFFKKRDGGNTRDVGGEDSSCTSSSDEEEAEAVSNFPQNTSDSNFASQSRSSAASPASTAVSTQPKIKKHSSSHGFSAIVSRKLTEGLTTVRVDTRDDFRRMLAKIEGILFEALPGEQS